MSYPVRGQSCCLSCHLCPLPDVCLSLTGFDLKCLSPVFTLTLWDALPLTLLHSGGPKLHTILVILSAVGLIFCCIKSCSDWLIYILFISIRLLVRAHYVQSAQAF